MSTRLLAVLLACVALAAACTTSVGDVTAAADSVENTPVSDTAPDPEVSVPATEAQPTPTPAPDAAGGSVEAQDFSVLASLGLIPESAVAEDSFGIDVVVADVDAAADQARLRPPLDLADADDLIDFWGPLTGFSRNDRPLRVFVPLPSIVRERALADPQDFIGELGFSPGEISSFVAVDSPPEEFFVFGGVSLPPDLAQVAPGVGAIGEGDDMSIDVTSRSAARPLGRPLRVAQQGQLVALSRTTPPVEDWLAGNGPTLADDPVLARLANRLDGEQVVSAYLFARREDGPAGTALGWRADDRGPQGIIVLAYNTDAEAAAMLDAVAQSFESDSLALAVPIDDLVVLDTIELLGSEIVVTVDFAPDRNPMVLFNLFIQGDGPFAVS